MHGSWWPWHGWVPRKHKVDYLAEVDLGSGITTAAWTAEVDLGSGIILLLGSRRPDWDLDAPIGI
jgi:hypothetical protein